MSARLTRREQVRPVEGVALNLGALRKNLAARQGNGLEDSNPPRRTNALPSKSARNAPDVHKTAPHSVEAEQGVLSSMLQDPAKAIPKASRECQPWFFYVPAHKIIFEVLVDRWDSGESFDMIAVTQFLRDKGLLDQVGGVGFIADLQTFVPTAANVPHYIEIVREKAMLREMISAGTELVRRSHGEVASAAEIMELADKFGRKIERVKQEAGGPNGFHEMTAEHLRGLKSVLDKNSLVGNRWLVRGGNSLWAGGAGYGKSSLTMQLAVYWACGQSVFGLKPHFPIKSLIVQAENDDHDMAEQYNGVMEGIGATGDLDVAAQQDTIDKNLTVLRVEGLSGLAFVGKLHDLLELYRPAILWLDPLFSFAGCDLIDAEKTGRFLREGLFPLFTKFSCHGAVIHHVGKPARAQQAPTLSAIDEQYLSFGSSEIQNAFRAVNVIKPPTQDAPGVFKLVLSKRGPRAQAKDPDGQFTTSIYLKHSYPNICWQQVEEPEKPKKGGAAIKYETSDVLEEMSTVHGMTTDEVLNHMKKECGMSARSFYRLWKDLKESSQIKVDSEGKWTRKLKLKT